MPDRTRLLVAAVTCAAGVATGAVWWPGPVFVLIAIGFVLAQVIPMPTPSRLGVSMVPALAGATALVSHGSAVLVVGAGAASLPLSLLVVHILHGRGVGNERFPSEPVGVAVFGATFGLVVPAFAEYDLAGGVTLLAYAAAACCGFVASSLVRATIAARGPLPRRLRLIRALEDWPAHAVLYAAAALYAITLPSMGWWSVPLAGLPYGFGYLSLHRLQVTRRTYDQTIRALGRIPEAGGMVVAGHMERTAELAVAIGSELGLGGQALDRLEHAALLHDVGRLVLANPAVAATAPSAADVAAWSSAIIGEAAHLAPVADLVAVMRDPYRRPGEPRDPGLAPAAQALRIASAYDHAVSTGKSPIEAIESLHVRSAYDYDPDVIAVLRGVLVRRGVVAA
ncbi:MAG: hypothetical protein HZA58_01725 [Acidimicrobiia bacterium]|nr:hypothetical protein [Acidimicrobiia bacterium]